MLYTMLKNILEIIPYQVKSYFLLLVHSVYYRIYHKIISFKLIDTQVFQSFFFVLNSASVNNYVLVSLNGIFKTFSWVYCWYMEMVIDICISVLHCDFLCRSNQILLNIYVWEETDLALPFWFLFTIHNLLSSSFIYC